MVKIKQGETRDADGNLVAEEPKPIENIQEHLEGLIEKQQAVFDNLQAQLGGAQRAIEKGRPQLIAIAAQLAGNKQLYQDVTGKPWQASETKDAG